MFNSKLPTEQELPSTAQLLRSTFIALIVAIVLLVTTVLPGEYGIDPTGMGRVLGLTQMGEIKEQLADEAAADRALAQQSQAAPVIVAQPQSTVVVAAKPAPQVEKTPEPVTPVVETPKAAVVAKAPEAIAPKPVAKPLNSDSTSLVLRPGEPAEIKLEMKKGEKVKFSWSANGGKLNFDTHGDPYNAPRGFYHGYGKGRFQPGESGELVAAFDGKHGWFWRNRTQQNVTLTLEVEGEFKTMKRVL